MPLRDLRAIYEILFRDGVMVAKKDKRPQTKHPEVQGVSNLQVIRAMGSLKSRGFVKETFAWRHFYWYLTNEGIVYLRNHLRLPPEIVPASLQRVRKPTSTLAVAHRGARVQSVEGPTSYVPKPGRRGEGESQEALAERQGYRHRMMGPGERESYSDRTPRFRGRPLATEPDKGKASQEMDNLSMRRNNLRSEAMMMEESRGKQVFHQQMDDSRPKAVPTSQQRSVAVQKEKAFGSVPAPKSALRQDVSQTTLTSVSPDTAQTVTVAAVAKATDAATLKFPAEPSSLNTSSSLEMEVKEEKARNGIAHPVRSTGARGMAEMVTEVKPKPSNENAKEEKVIVDPVNSAKYAARTVTDKANKMTPSLEPSKLLTEIVSFTPATTKAEPRRAKVSEETIKPAVVQSSVESTTDCGKTKKAVKAAITQQIAKLQPEGSTAMEKISKLTVTQEPQVAEVTIIKSKTEILSATSTTMLSTPKGSTEGAKPVTMETAKEMTKPANADVEVVPQTKEDQKMAPVTAGRPSGAAPSCDQEAATSKLSQTIVTAEVDVETKQVDGNAKSKRKKKKSPVGKASAEATSDRKVEEQNTCQDKIPEDAAENTFHSPLKTSEIVTSSMKTEKTTPAGRNSTKTNIDPESVDSLEERSKQLDQLHAAPPVVATDVKVKKNGDSKVTQGPLSSKAKFPHAEPKMSEEITATQVKTVTVQKITTVELVQESGKSEENPLAAEFKSSVNNAAEGPSKSKKKGKGRKQAQDTLNIKTSILPEAEALPPTDITSLPRESAKDSPVTASELTSNVSPKMTAERMCSEETRQPTAALSEAPADKGEVEPTLVCAEKLKREVPKPKTSFSAREAPVAVELASAAPVVTAQAAVAQTQASPLVEQVEPPRVAQRLTQTAECSTERRLSVPGASKQEEEKKKDLEEDTPSATATPVTAQAHLGDTCTFVISEIDEATMKRKIVVVEEIVEVKQVVSPNAAGEQPPPQPVQPNEEEEEELDLDVLEAIAIEKALLSGAARANVQGASPEAEWDHSLEEPEEKTWPNFVEGLSESLTPTSCLVLSLCM